MTNGLRVYTDKIDKIEYNLDLYKLWWKNISYRSNTTGKPSNNSINTYASNLLKFLKYYKGPIYTVTINDIFVFFDCCDKELSASSKKGYVLALLDYISFLKDKNTLAFDSRILLYKAESDKADFSPDPITIDEFILLRNNLKQNNKYYDMLIIELIYFYGFTLEQLGYCKSRNYSFEKSCFIINGKSYYMDEQVEENIMACSNTLDSSNEKDYVKAINKMGNMFNKHFNYKTFYNLRQKHLIVCPSCSNKYVNDSRFWVLAQRKNDLFDTKVLLCRKCASKFKG